MIGFPIHHTVTIRVLEHCCIFVNSEVRYVARKEGWHYELDSRLGAWFYEQEIRPILYIMKNPDGFIELWVRFHDDADAMAYKFRWG